LKRPTLLTFFLQNINVNKGVRLNFLKEKSISVSRIDLFFASTVERFSSVTSPVQEMMQEYYKNTCN